MTKPSRVSLILVGALLLSARPGAVGEPVLRRSISVESASDGLRSAVQRLAKRGRESVGAAPRALPVAHSPVGVRRSGPVSARRPVPAPAAPPRGNASIGDELVRSSKRMATEGYPYVFGGETPDEGGFDCSGIVHYLLMGLGKRDVPRVAYDQYRWLESEGALTKLKPWTSPERLFAKLRPGDLLFWTGTYQTGRSPNISHVMVYLGKDPATGLPQMFGARNSSLKGKHGHSVDIFPFKYPKRGGRGTLVGFGPVP